MQMKIAEINDVQVITWHDMTWRDTTRHDTWHDTTRHSIKQHNTTQHNTTQHNVTQYNITYNVTYNLLSVCWVVRKPIYSIFLHVKYGLYFAYKGTNVKFVLCRTQRRMGNWIYSCRLSSPLQYMQMNGQCHVPAALTAIFCLDDMEKTFSVFRKLNHKSLGSQPVA